MIKGLHWRYNQMENKYKPDHMTTIFSNLPDKMDKYFGHPERTVDHTPLPDASSPEEQNPTQTQQSSATHLWSPDNSTARGVRWLEPPFPAEDRLVEVPLRQRQGPDASGSSRQRGGRGRQAAR